MYPPLARVKTPLAPWLTLSWSFLNVLTFVWPVPPLATATALFTSPLEVRPAFALPAPPDTVEAATLLTLAVSAAVFALVTSAPSE